MSTVYDTAAETARRLRISRSRLYDLVREGRIPAIHTGGKGSRVLFVPEAVDAALSRSAYTAEVPAPPAAPATSEALGVSPEAAETE